MNLNYGDISRTFRIGVKWVFALMLVSFLIGSSGFCGEIDRLTNFLPSDKLFDVEVIGQNIWTVGYKGRIFHSADHGASWEFQESGTKEPLFCVSFSSARDGMAVGEFGTIIRTTDGGKSWSVVKRFTENTLRGVCFMDDKQACVVGSFSTILMTRNAGITWTDHSIVENGEPVDTFLAGVYFTDPDNGWAVGEFSTILHSSDGGLSWQAQEAGVEDSLYLTNVFFLNESEGWIVGIDGTILHTVDAGATWTQQESGVKDLLLDLSVSASGIGFAVGTRGAVCTTVDGGNSWERFEGAKDFPKWWYGAVAFDGQMGVITGGRATIIVTNNQGKSWRLLEIF